MKQKTHAAEHTEEHAQSRSMMQEVWRRFKKNKGAVVESSASSWSICVLAISAGFVYDYDTQVVGGDVTQRLQSPSWEHPFGTDEMGRDILIRVIYGARYCCCLSGVAGRCHRAGDRRFSLALWLVTSVASPKISSCVLPIFLSQSPISCLPSPSSLLWARARST